MPVKELPPDQFWKLQEKLPQELRDALWSPETGNDIHETIERHDTDEHGQKISWLVGQVLLGLLLPQEIEKEIRNLGVEEETARSVARDLNRLIFYPIKPALEQLHRMEIEVSAKIVTPKPEEAETTEEKPEEPKGDDTYREPIE
jgi:hypothetical protein